MSRHNKAKAIVLGLMTVSINCLAYITHEVKRGETLWGLSHKYNVTPEAITDLNPSAKNGLKTGMKLRIPEPSDTGTETSADNSVNQTQTQTQTDDTPLRIVGVIDLDDQEEESQKDADTAPYLGNTIEATQEITESTPVQTYNTSELYTARFGDTFGSIAAKTGVSEAALLKYNPFVKADNVSEGYVIRLSADAPYIPYTTPLSTVDSIIYRVQPVKADKDVNNTREKTIAVMLPFDVDNDVIPRQSLLATEFYRGFLIATHKATTDRKLPLRIIAIDTQCDSIQFDARLNQLSSEHVDIIIPPDDDRQLAKIEDFALDNNAIVLNVLNIKDEGYLTHPNVVQCNITQKQMYDKAIKALMTDFAEYTPVILDLAGGKTEKGSFIEELTSQYESKGLKVINLAFKNTLERSDLSNLSSTGKYIFIPKSGNVEVFNKISNALIEVVEENIVEDRFKVFGYPDWITYRGEQEEALHRMGANIYSRFYLDATDFRTDDANNEYKRWFGGQMEEVYPSQGLLGYDAGTLLYNALSKSYGDDDMAKLSQSTYEGVQSAFKFTHDEQSAGIINDTLYLIEYLPGSILYVKTI